MGEDITKEQLKKEIQDILKDADLDNTSAKKVRMQLQEKLDCDLTDRKKEVDELVMEVIDEQTQDDEEEEEEAQEEESESEEERKPKKKVAAKPKPKAKAKRAASESGSEFSPEGSDDEEEATDFPNHRRRASAPPQVCRTSAFAPRWSAASRSPWPVYKQPRVACDDRRVNDPSHSSIGAERPRCTNESTTPCPRSRRSNDARQTRFGRVRPRVVLRNRSACRDFARRRRCAISAAVFPTPRLWIVAACVTA